MTYYSWKGLSKPLAPIGASYVGGAKRQLIIFSYIVWLLWDCGIGYPHKLGWRGLSQAIFTIWRWFLSSALGTLLKARLFEGPHVSLCCGLYGEKGTLEFSRTFGRHWRWCGICFISMFLFGLTLQTFLNLSFECNST